jgi:hypothetical protein
LTFLLENKYQKDKIAEPNLTISEKVVTPVPACADGNKFQPVVDSDLSEGPGTI